MAAQIALNPVFTVFFAMKKGDIDVPRLMKDETAVSTLREALSSPGWRFNDNRFPLYRRPDESSKAVNRPNIAILLLESWPAAAVGCLGSSAGITPCVDRLAANGWLFTRFFATGHRSTDGLSALLLSVPTFENVQIIGSSLEQHRFRGLAEILRESGYSTLFVHGAKTGSLGLDAFAKVAGFDVYVGKERMTTRNGDIEPVWGVYDRPSLENLASQIDNLKPPFFAFWFSLTSHHPFHLPDHWEKAPIEGPDAAFRETIRYSDAAIGRFFEIVSRKPFFRDTIFILVADHTAGQTLSGSYERHRIPCLIYAPGRLPARKDDRIASQIDLLPTVLDLCGIRSGHHSFGSSLVKERGRRFAFLNRGWAWGWAEDGWILSADEKGSQSLFKIPEDAAETFNVLQEHPEVAARYSRTVGAFVQLGTELLKDNRLTPKSDERAESRRH